MSATAPARTNARTRYAHNIYFLDGAVVTAVLVLLLYLILAVSLDAASYVNNLTVLAPVTIGAFTLGLLMSYSRFDGFFALSHSMFVGLAWILFLTSRSVDRAHIAPLLGNDIPEMQAQAYYVLLQWLNWIDSLLDGAASANNYFFVLEMCFLTWWLTYLGVWSIFRYGYTWRAIIPAGMVLLINAYYAPSSVIGFLIVFLFIALILLVRTNLAEHQLGWRQRRVIYSQDIALDFLRNGFIYSVIIVALALLLPGLGRNPQVRGVLEPVNQQWEFAQERVNQMYQGLNRQAGGSYSTFGNTLTLSGARNTSNETVLRVRTSQGRYWRAIVYDTFDGRSWLRTDVEKVAFNEGELLPVAPWLMREPLTQTITLDAPIGYILVSAPDLARISTSLNADVSPAWPTSIAQDGETPDVESQYLEVTLAQSRHSFGAGDSYTVVSMNTSVTERALLAASTDYPQQILDTYLQLPEDFSQRVTQDALDVTAEEETVYDKARALERRLRTIEYNDAIEVPPEDRDPVEYFLYDVQQGYCDYYATAMTLMLRSLGIPARPVSGYAEGYWDKESGDYVVTQQDAHTWVEVFFPEYGWIEFEPTASESQLNRPQGNEENGDSLAQGLGSTTDVNDSGSNSGEESFSEFDNPNDFGDDFDIAGDTRSPFNRYWWVWALASPIVLLVGFHFLRRMRVIGPTRFGHDFAPILYERLYRWAERLGYAVPDSHTPNEVAIGLSSAVPEGRDSIHTIADNYVEFRFGPRYNDQADEESQTAWRTLQPQLWKTWLRKITRRNKNGVDSAYRLVDE